MTMIMSSRVTAAYLKLLALTDSAYCVVRGVWEGSNCVQMLGVPAIGLHRPAISGCSSGSRASLILCAFSTVDCNPTFWSCHQFITWLIVEPILPCCLSVFA